MWENKKQEELLRNNSKATGCCDMIQSGQGIHNPDCNFQVRPSRYTDFRATARYIYRTEGIMAFTKGILPRMSINVPSTALSWGTYEFIKSLLIGQDGKN